MHDWQHSAEGINAGAQTVVLPKSAGHSAAFFFSQQISISRNDQSNRA
jgi:hypothetical protein